MSIIRFTLIVEIPDNATVRVDTPAVAVSGAPAGTAASSYPPLDEAPFPGMDEPVVNDLCPVHRVPWKVVPAGVSKKTGQPYASFRACPESGCEKRPGR